MPLVGTNGTFILAWPTRLERDVERQPDRSGLERDNGDKAGLVQAVVDQGTRDWTVLVGDVPRVDADRVPLIQCYRSIEDRKSVGWGKGGSVMVDFGGRRRKKKKKKHN